MSSEITNRITPQLVMIKKELLSLSSVNLPLGYTIRTFEPGDELNWENIINEAFGNKYDFIQLIQSNDYYRPELVFFICFGGVPVATATAWYSQKWGEHTGYLHMVGSRLSHRGKGLGLQVSLAALRKMADEGREEALLQTDDFRVAAIKIYLKLGFKPFIVNENQYERWGKIMTILGINDSYQLGDENK